MTRETSDIRVGLVGYGTIGRRLARAVSELPGFRLADVATRRRHPALAQLEARGTRIHVSQSAEAHAAVSAMLDGIDIVLDCTPRGMGGVLDPIYRAAGVRVIYQGGEADGLAEAEYCFGIGFEALRHARSVRIPSCNTTALVRLASALGGTRQVARLRAVITRSATDPDKAFKGTGNALTAGAGLSHHGDDARRFIPGLDVATLAASAPVNCGHLAALFIEMRQEMSAAETLARLGQSVRIAVLTGGTGSLHDLWQAGSGHGRDCPSVLLWPEAVSVTGREVALFAGIHMESIVIPETLDALQAMAATALGASAAMAVSDRIVGLHHGSISYESAVA